MKQVRIGRYMIEWEEGTWDTNSGLKLSKQTQDGELEGELFISSTSLQEVLKGIDFVRND